MHTENTVPDLIQKELTKEEIEAAKEDLNEASAGITLCDAIRDIYKNIYGRMPYMEDTCIRATILAKRMDKKLRWYREHSVVLDPSEKEPEKWR